MEDLTDGKSVGCPGAQLLILSESNKVLQEENASMQKTVAQQKELIAKLEDDLSSVNALQRPEAIVRFFF